MFLKPDTIPHTTDNRETDAAVHAAHMGRIDSAEQNFLTVERDRRSDRETPSRAARIALANADTLGSKLSVPSKRRSENPFPAIRQADFIHAMFPDVVMRTDNTAETSASDIFGHSSTLEQPVAPETFCESRLTGNVVFQGMVIVVAAAYILLLARYLTEAYTLVCRTLRENAKNSRMFDNLRGSYINFITFMTLLGMPLLGIAVVKYADVHAGSLLNASSPYAAAIPAAAIVAAGMFALLAVAQTALLKIVGYITLTQGFISDLLYLRRAYFSLMVLVSAPSVLLYALCGEHIGGFWYYAAIATAVITAGLYIKEALVLFIAKKISILRWFLYLCAIDIFPFSLIWLLAVKH